uniref:Uncharacterized protein n=1 Tax=Arion vulgaris TaxID=1028688 RepID=A0A0B7BTD8_9EUPU
MTCSFNHGEKQLEYYSAPLIMDFFSKRPYGLVNQWQVNIMQNTYILHLNIS